MLFSQQQHHDKDRLIVLPPETEVNTPHEGVHLVHDDHLLVVRPQVVGDVSAGVVRVPEDLAGQIQRITNWIDPKRNKFLIPP